jgi:phosphoribosyl-dephospho-CoA transferase
MFKRHSLVWLNSRGWQDVRVGDEQRCVVQRWQAAHWPLIVRRRDADAAADDICLGIAAPPDAQGDKLRIPVRVRPAGVCAVREPLDIAEAVPHAGPHWRGALERLQQDAREEGVPVRVYGSLALQALTGQPYLRASSDIDLLLAPRDRHQLEQILDLLERHRRLLPLDGELEFPDGAAVSWKEWMQARGAAGNRVLVKRAADVVLLRIGDLLAGLGEHRCSA